QPSTPTATPAFRSGRAYEAPQFAPSRPLDRVQADRLGLRIRVPPLSNPARRFSRDLLESPAAAFRSPGQAPSGKRISPSFGHYTPRAGFGEEFILRSI